jgi:hypothetical protein
MDTRKLTLDIIKEYIRDNINSFTDEEILIEVAIPKKKDKVDFQVSSSIKETPKTLEQIISSIDKKSGIDANFPIECFSNLYSKNLLDNFLILNSISQLDIQLEQEDINIKNLSFYYSIFSAVEPNFLKMSSENKFQAYINLISYLKKDIMIDGFKQHQYSKLKWTKNDIVKNLEKNVVDNKVIRYVSDALHLNIFYIDGDDTCYVGGDFIVFKKMIFMLKYNDRYYLLTTKEDKLFTFNSNYYIKSILTHPDNLKLIFTDKFNAVSFDWTKLLNLCKKSTSQSETKSVIAYNDKLNGYDIDEETVKDETPTLIEKQDEYINENMSLIELQKKAKELNIDTFHYVNSSRKFKNKRELCKDILSK